MEQRQQQQQQQQQEQEQEGEYRPRIQGNEQHQRFFTNSVQDPDLMTIDQCETMRELDDLQLVGPPPPPPPPPPATTAVSTAIVGSIGDVNMVDVEVRTAVKAVDVSTVKRKRGRPPRIQGKTTGPPPQPRRKTTTTTDDEEDVCFICFDGGSLVLCDRR